MLFGIWTLGWPLWWIIKLSPTKVIVLSAGTLDNNKNLWLCMVVMGVGVGGVLGGEGGGVDGIIVVRSLYCTQNKSAPQDSWGNNTPCHCACNYTQEGMWSDWLLCQRWCHPTTPTFRLNTSRRHAGISGVSHQCETTPHPVIILLGTSIGAVLGSFLKPSMMSFTDYHLILHGWRGN